MDPREKREACREHCLCPQGNRRRLREPGLAPKVMGQMLHLQLSSPLPPRPTLSLTTYLRSFCKYLFEDLLHV